MNLKTIIKYLICWRLAIILISIPAIFILPIRDGYTQLKEGFSLSNLFVMWSSFDGFHYLQIAKHWYGTIYTNNIYAFFPLYPLLIRILNVFRSELVTGLVLSHTAFVAAVLFLYKITKIDFGPKIAKTTVLLLLIFPTSFYFGSLYSESLFLLLTVSCFYALRKNNFVLATSIAALASATRLSGIFLWLSIAIYLWEKNGRNLKKLVSDTKLTYLSLPPLGLLLYLRLQYDQTGNFLKFITEQPAFGANRVVNKLILLHQVFFRYLRMLVFVDHTDPLFFTVLMEFIVGIVFLLLVLYSFKKLNLSYAVYNLLSYLVPTFTGTLMSLPRYVLTIFPAFILLAGWFRTQPKLIQVIYVAVNILFSVFAISLFTRGYFVS